MASATLWLGACTPAHGVLKHCKPEVGNICPWAGTGENGFNGDGLDRLDTWFSFPMSVTISPLGPTVLFDWNNHRLRELEDDGTLQTVMGTDIEGDGDVDHLDATPAGAPGTTVRLNHPTQGEYFDDGVLLAAIWHTHKLRTWDPATGLVHVYLGGEPGFETVEGGSAEEFHDADNCLLSQPSHVEITPNQNVYIVDMRNERIRLLLTEPWLVGTAAGNGAKGYCGEGDAHDVCFGFPKSENPEPGGSIALAPERDLLYVADTENHAIRIVDLAAGTTRLLAGMPGEAGNADGYGTDARFDRPTRLVYDAADDLLFVADADNNEIRTVDPITGEVKTFAGTGERTCDGPQAENVPLVCDDQARSGDGGPAVEAKLYRPFGVDLDLDGNVIISDTYDNRYRIVYR